MFRSLHSSLHAIKRSKIHVQSNFDGNDLSAGPRQNYLAGFPGGFPGGSQVDSCIEFFAKFGSGWFSGAPITVVLLAMRRLLATKTALVSILTRNEMENEKIWPEADTTLRFFSKYAVYFLWTFSHFGGATCSSHSQFVSLKSLSRER